MLWYVVLTPSSIYYFRIPIFNLLLSYSSGRRTEEHNVELPYARVGDVARSGPRRAGAAGQRGRKGLPPQLPDVPNGRQQGI